MSDSKKLDWLALSISLASLLVSGLSAWYSYSQMGLTAGQIKAYVQVSEAKLVGPLKADTTLYVQVQLKLKNFGQTAATNAHGDMDYKEGSPNMNHESNDATVLPFGSMGPGFERTVTLTSNRRNNRDWPIPSYRGDKVIYFYGTGWYTDDTTGQDRKADWCYQLPVKTDDDLNKRTDLEPCTILTFESKRDPLKEDN